MKLLPLIITVGNSPASWGNAVTSDILIQKRNMEKEEMPLGRCYFHLLLNFTKINSQFYKSSHLSYTHTIIPINTYHTQTRTLYTHSDTHTYTNVHTETQTCTDIHNIYRYYTNTYIYNIHTETGIHIYNIYIYSTHIYNIPTHI